MHAKPPVFDYRKTKIIATIGPASRSKEMLKKLVAAGVNVLRLNFSHGTHEDHFATLKNIRAVTGELGVVVAVLQDLSGPKIRISNVVGDFVSLTNNETVELCHANGSLTTPSVIYVEGVTPAKILKAGESMLLSDGLITLRAESVKKDSVICTIIKGGRLRSRAGIAFPESAIDLPATTDKDLEDLKWGLANEIDFIALSFVKNAQDIISLRDSIKSATIKPKLIAKIERKQALDHIDQIIGVADGVMVARGDLGLELPLETLPRVQNDIISRCNTAGVPVIVATQMLHSMVTSIRPTRAEVSDIAAAVMSGTDAVMLSEETAIGEYPVECVEILSRIAHEAEHSLSFSANNLEERHKDLELVPDSIAFAAVAAAKKVDAAAIVSCTETGTTSRLVAKYRPEQPHYGASIHDFTLRRMMLYRGVIPIHIQRTASHADEIDAAIRAIKKHENIKGSARIVIIGGLSVQKPGSTSVLEIREA
jgi:pyruvate kinase